MRIKMHDSIKINNWGKFSKETHTLFSQDLNQMPIQNPVEPRTTSTSDRIGTSSKHKKTKTI